MNFSEITLDDLMHKILTTLLELPFDITSTRSGIKGSTSELIGTMIHLKNPRARLSRTETRGKLFSALGELFWYFSKTNDLDFISYYLPKYKNESEDGKTVYGGYGPRFFNKNGIDQIENVIQLLKAKKTTRRAVIQIFDAIDLTDLNRKEVPCTCTMQFFIRNEKLHMFTTMRSNDAFIGLPHDIFVFTLLQEIIARDLSVELGEYSHAVGSLHLYSYDIDQAKQYINEGIQSTLMNMPPMPIGNPWSSIENLKAIELDIREGKIIDICELDLDSYWKDIARLLLIFRHGKSKNEELIRVQQQKMACSVYNTYIEKKLEDIN